MDEGNEPKSREGRRRAREAFAPVIFAGAMMPKSLGPIFDSFRLSSEWLNVLVRVGFKSNLAQLSLGGFETCGLWSSSTVYWSKFRDVGKQHSLPRNG